MNESGIIDEFFSWANIYVAGCYIVNSNINNLKIYATASFSFIDTGRKKLGVTNNHVLKEYEKHAQNEEFIDFYVGDFSFNPKELLIDSSPDLDIATFDFDVVDMAKIGNNNSFCTVESWPPPRVKEKDKVLFSGFPGQFVKKGIPESIFYSVSLMERVYSVEHDYFTLLRDLQSPNYKMVEGAIDISNFCDQGGFSGSLVLNVKKKNNLEIVVPCGIIYEGINSLGQITYVRHIDLIASNGSFS